MNKNTRETLLTCGYILAGLAGVVAAGLVMWQDELLTWHRLLPYLVLGFFAGAVYAAARLSDFAYALLLGVFFCVVQGAVSVAVQVVARYGHFVPIRIPWLAAAVPRMLPVAVALIVSAYLLRAMPRLRFGKLLVMAAVLALGYVGTLAVSVRGRPLLFRDLVWRQVLLGATLGGFMGAGLELVDWLGFGRRTRSERGET